MQTGRGRLLVLFGSWLPKEHHCLCRRPDYVLLMPVSRDFERSRHLNYRVLFACPDVRHFKRK